MTKFGWTVALLILALIGTVVGGVVFFTYRTEPALPSEPIGEIQPTPIEETTNPAGSTTSVGSSTQASSTTE